MNLNTYIFVAFLSGAVSLVFAWYKVKSIVSIVVADEKLKRISSYVARGARSFIYREYKVLAPFVIIVAMLLFLGNRAELSGRAEITSHLFVEPGVLHLPDI